MKTIPFIKYSLPVVLLLTLGSCNQFLEVQPQNSISDEVTITDKSSSETAVRGVYSALASNGYYGVTYQAIGYLSGDNVKFTGTQVFQNQFVSHTVRADNSFLASAWPAIYNTINRANHVIAKVPNVTDAALTADLKNQLLGEAYFVRALAYFDLARVWGGVQLVLTPTVSVQDKDGIKRSTLAQTYAQVLSDLIAAEPLLPQTTNRVRATRKTVWALRARYHLYQKEWALAETYASKLIDDATNYTLVKPYSAFFANNAVGTAESIFEISYTTTNPNTHRTSWQPSANGGSREWAPSDAFLTLVNDPLIGGNRSALVAKTSAGLWYGNLYYRSPATDPAYILRIAEQVLIRAEARAQLGNLTGSLADLNAIRSRAGITASAAATQTDVLLAIENERRVELAFEPHRWFDLLRTNRAGTVLGITDPNKYVLPVPVGELNADKALEQNAGY